MKSLFYMMVADIGALHSKTFIFLSKTKKKKKKNHLLRIFEQIFIFICSKLCIVFALVIYNKN